MKNWQLVIINCYTQFIISSLCSLSPPVYTYIRIEHNKIMELFARKKKKRERYLIRIFLSGQASDHRFKLKFLIINHV